jgi:hypothetical protein
MIAMALTVYVDCICVTNIPIWDDLRIFGSNTRWKTAYPRPLARSLAWRPGVFAGSGRLERQRQATRQATRDKTRQLETKRENRSPELGALCSPNMQSQAASPFLSLSPDVLQHLAKLLHDQASRSDSKAFRDVCKQCDAAFCSELRALYFDHQPQDTDAFMKLVTKTRCIERCTDTANHPVLIQVTVSTYWNEEKATAAELAAFLARLDLIPNCLLVLILDDTVVGPTIPATIAKLSKLVELTCLFDQYNPAEIELPESCRTFRCRRLVYRPSDKPQLFRKPQPQVICADVNCHLGADSSIAAVFPKLQLLHECNNKYGIGRSSYPPGTSSYLPESLRAWIITNNDLLFGTDLGTQLPLPQLLAQVSQLQFLAIASSLQSYARSSLGALHQNIRWLFLLDMPDLRDVPLWPDLDFYCKLFPSLECLAWRRILVARHLNFQTALVWPYDKIPTQLNQFYTMFVSPDSFAYKYHFNTHYCRALEQQQEGDPGILCSNFHDPTCLIEAVYLHSDDKLYHLVDPQTPEHPLKTVMTLATKLPVTGKPSCENICKFAVEACGISVNLAQTSWRRP